MFQAAVNTPCTGLLLGKSKYSQRHQPAIVAARTPKKVSASLKAAIKAGATALFTLEDPLLLSARGADGLPVQQPMRPIPEGGARCR
jgi:hypothetical protein